MHLSWWPVFSGQCEAQIEKQAQETKISDWLLANPNTENGYIKIANELWEALCRIRIPGEARQCLDVIIRKTYGFNKKKDRISYGQISNMTGLSRPKVFRGLKILMDMNIVYKDSDGYINILGITVIAELAQVIPIQNFIPVFVCNVFK